MKYLLIMIILSKFAFSQFSSDNDGVYKVGEVAGDLNYSYLISGKNVDGHPFQVSMEYVSNANFVNLIKYDRSDNGNDIWVKDHKVEPVWLLNVNGFAVDVFSGIKAPSNVSKASDIDRIYYNFNNDEIGDDQKLWLLEGFDVCNRMEQLDKIGDHDKIKILKSDGSILELVNETKFTSTSNVNDTNLYTGYYFHNSYNSNIYAKVEYDPNGHFPSYLKKYYDDIDTNQFKPRIVKLYLGDGLEYKFREWVSPLGARILDKVASFDSVYQYQFVEPPQYYNGYWNIRNATPTVFYLEEINNSIKTISTFKRYRHEFDSDTIDVSRGRAHLMEFKGHEIKWGDFNISINSFGRVFNFNFFLRLYNEWGDDDGWYEQDTIKSYFGIKDEQYFSNHYIRDNNFDGKFRNDFEYQYARDTLKEFNRSYSFTDQAYNILIDRIVDPEAREVNFNYEKIINKYPDYYSVSYRLKEIEQPDKFVEFSFKEEESLSNDDYHKTSHDVGPFPMKTISYLANATDTLKHSIMDVIDTVTVFDKYDGLKTDTLKQITYIFDIEEKSSSFNEIYKRVLYNNGTVTEETDTLSFPAGEYKSSRIIEKDMISGHIVQKEMIFSIDSITPYHQYSTNWTYKTPDYRVYNLVKTHTRFGKEDQTNSEGDLLQYSLCFNADSITNGSRMIVLPEKTIGTYYSEKHNGFVLKSYSTLEYEFSQINNFGGNSSLSAVHGISTRKTTTKNYRPDDLTLLSYNIQTRKFLADTIKTMSYTDSLYKPLKTIRSRKINKKNGVQSTSKILDLPNVSSEIRIQPVKWDLIDSSLTYDKNDVIISGFLMNYAETVDASNPQAKRGALLSDTIIGYNGVKRVGNVYSYRTGRYKNFISSVKNSIGATTKLYHNYSDAGGNPTGTVMYNTEGTSSITLYDEFDEFEGPIASERIIRKYNQYGVPYNTSLKTFNEKTNYGLIKGSIDENGWYSRNEFDKNGRVTTVWFPYDFPTGSGSGKNADYQIPFDSIKTSVYKKIDRISLDYDYIDPDEWILEKDIYDYLGFGRYLGYTKPGLDSILVVNDTVSVYELKSKLIYIANSNDKLHSCSSIQDVTLDLFMNGDITNKFTTLRISSDQFGYKKLLTLGGAASMLMEGYGDLTINMEGDIPHIELDLSSIKDSMINMSNGDILTFTIEHVSFNGSGEFLTHDEDLSPSIGLTAPCDTEHNDYTYHYEYDDEKRQKSKFTKVDDDEYSKHNYVDGWQKTWSDHDGRYFKTKQQFGAAERVSHTEINIGHPDSPDRKDSMDVDLSGFNLPNKITDEDQLDWVSTYDSRLRPISKMAPDSFKVHTSYNTFFAPDTTSTFITDTLLDGLDLYGSYTVIKNYHDTTEIVNEIYKDARGRILVNRRYSDTLDTYTKYYYSEIGRLEKTVNQSNDTIKYVYDDFNKLKYKYQKDQGLSSYSYDKLGNLRFSQNQLQADSNRISFYEYDDLGRATYVGEAKIEEGILSTSEPSYPGGVGESFDRLTDLIDPDSLHYSGFGLGNDYGVTTANNTWFLGVVPPQFQLNSLDSSSCLPQAIYFPEDTSISSPSIMHKTINYASDTLTASSPYEFENLGVNVQNVLVANWYDNEPERYGAIWGGLPNSAKWDSVGTSFENLKGKLSAKAYRNTHNDNFHFIKYSYDARGRVEKIIRYTENIGWDGVFYRYNSSNSVVSIKVSDPLRTYMVWYSYDNNNRVDSVWATVDTVGSGFGISSLHSPNDLTKPEQALTFYSYNKKGTVDSSLYLPLMVSTHYNYNDRGFLDSINTYMSGNEIFKEVLERNEYGLITKQTSKNQCMPENIQNYYYDGLNRLTQHVDGITGVSNYSYDIKGNRTKHEVNFNIDDYIYGTGFNDNKLLEVRGSSSGKLFRYNSVGAVIETVDSNFSGTKNTLEEFEYNSMGLLNRYISYDVAGDYSSYTCDSETKTSDYFEWKYRYSPFGGLESKRMLYSPYGDSCDYIHPWLYNLSGIDGAPLVTYHGKQTAKDTCSKSDRRVYYYPVNYLVPGSNIKLNTENTSELYVKDHLGNVRLVVNGTSCSLKSYDYKAFGGISISGDVNIPTDGFRGLNKGREMTYVQMGARLYDNSTGRFLSVDPLHESFSKHTPYHYSYNSPVNFKDPSGLAPESEKSKRKNRNEIRLMVAENIEERIINAPISLNMTQDYAKSEILKRMAEEIFERASHKADGMLEYIDQQMQFVQIILTFGNGKTQTITINGVSNRDIARIRSSIINNDGNFDGNILSAISPIGNTSLSGEIPGHGGFKLNYGKMDNKFYCQILFYGRERDGDYRFYQTINTSNPMNNEKFRTKNGAKVDFVPEPDKRNGEDDDLPFYYDDEQRYNENYRYGTIASFSDIPSRSTSFISWDAELSLLYKGLDDHKYQIIFSWSWGITKSDGTIKVTTFPSHLGIDPSRDHSDFINNFKWR